MKEGRGMMFMEDEKAKLKIELAKTAAALSKMGAPKFLLPPGTIFKIMTDEKELYKLTELLYGKEARKVLEEWFASGTYEKPLCKHGDRWKLCSYRTFVNLINEQIKEWLSQLSTLDLTPAEEGFVQQMKEKQKVGDGELRRILLMTTEPTRSYSIIHALVPLALIAQIDKGNIKGTSAKAFRTYMVNLFRRAQNILGFPDSLAKKLGVKL